MCLDKLPKVMIRWLQNTWTNKATDENVISFFCVFLKDNFILESCLQLFFFNIAFIDRPFIKKRTWLRKKYIQLMHFFSIYFSVSRRCGPWISNWSCLCIITFASDGRCSSCRITEDTDSSFALSHCIYLGCGHSHSFTCCQVKY